jgi:allantoinase
MELNPEPVLAMQKSGHEIASHNYRWIDFQKLTEEQEVAQIQSCISAFQSILGFAPKGWYTGRISEHSRRLVVEEYRKQCLELLWESDAYNDDLPYYEKDFGNVVVIPYTLDCNDMKFAVGPGFTSPEGFEQYVKDAISLLVSEGEAGSPKMLSIGLHCRLIGRPGRAAALKRVLEWVKDLELEGKVWVATRQAIASHWKTQFPAA